MEIHESAENYLETILFEQEKRGMVRSIDICNALGYSKPTVSVTMKRFRENGYIEMDDAGYITLTPKGREIAERMQERHEIIAQIFMALGVSEEVAYQDACKIEHDISEESFTCMKRHFLEKMEPEK